MASGDSDRCERASRAHWVRKIAIGCMASLVACAPPYYTADPIEAWVVDAETGQPIEGAVVTANWQLVSVGLDTGGRKLHQLEVKETRTDKNGRFYFPGFTKLNNMVDELREEDPQLLIFKPGYEYYRTASSYPNREGQPGAHRTARFNGEKLKLTNDDQNIKKAAANLSSLTTNLESIANAGASNEVPQMLRAVACAAKQLRAKDSHLIIPVLGNAETEKNCEPE